MAFVEVTPVQIKVEYSHIEDLDNYGHERISQKVWYVNRFEAGRWAICYLRSPQELLEV
jgi:hypothetical protein